MNKRPRGPNDPLNQRYYTHMVSCKAHKTQMGPKLAKEKFSNGAGPAGTLRKRLGHRLLCQKLSIISRGREKPAVDCRKMYVVRGTEGNALLPLLRNWYKSPPSRSERRESKGEELARCGCGDVDGNLEGSHLCRMGLELGRRAAKLLLGFGDHGVFVAGEGLGVELERLSHEFGDTVRRSEMVHSSITSRYDSPPDDHLVNHTAP